LLPLNVASVVSVCAEVSDAPDPSTAMRNARRKDDASSEGNEREWVWIDMSELDQNVAP